jgi:putative nucleotidyltransferase with HDIG domain
MIPDDLQTLQDWFSAYSGSFSTPVAEDQRNIAVKREHTREVRLNAARIAEDLRWGREETLLAEAAALFHDVGRFPQYGRYRTFDDSVSVNHGALGANVLLENNVLRDLPKRDRDVIIRSVTLHNVLTLPARLDDEILLFAKLVRDADKLDILRVVIEYFDQDQGSRAEAVALGLPDSPEYSQEVLSCLARGEMVQKSMLRTGNDFKLLQLAWLYDLNFTSAFRMVVERDYVRKLSDKLPRTDEIARAIDVVRRHVDGKLRDR